MQDSTSIVIIGAGYAGVRFANRVAARANWPCQVTLLNARPEFVDRIRLHEFIATGKEATRSLRDMLHASIDLRIVHVEHIDLANQRVSCRHASGETSNIRYHKLVMATGSIGSAPQDTIDVSNWESAAKARASFAACGANDRVLVVGGGPTGIEIAAEIAEQHRAAIAIATHGELAAGYSQPAQRKIRSALKDLKVTVHEHIDAVATAHLMREATVVLWAAGMRANPLAAKNQLTCDEQDRVIVDEYQRAINDPDIVAIGDCAVMTAQPLRMACATALPLATHAADNMLRQLRGKQLRPMSFSYQVQCLSLGRNSGILQRVTSDDRPTSLVIGGRFGARIKESIVRYASKAPRAQ
jgi:NADH:ubiquinone reductase (H+-translocating)